jgi:two-component system, LytTR family, response regulator
MKERLFLSSQNSLRIRSQSGTYLLNYLDIIKVESCSNYSKIFCHSRKHPILIAKVLGELERELPQAGFIRSNRSSLINLLFIKRIELKPKAQIVLSTGEVLQISRRRVNNVKSWQLLLA